MSKNKALKELQTVLLLALEDLFRRKFKSGTTKQQKVLLSSRQLFNHADYSFQKLMKKAFPDKRDLDKQFDKIIFHTLNQHKLYHLLKQTQQKNGSSLLFIRRICKFFDTDKIINRQTLLRTVYKSVEGILVDDELLNYSYAQVGRDIKDFLKSGHFVKIEIVNKSSQSYLIFPSLEDNVFGIPNLDRCSFADQYITICGEFENAEERIYVEPVQQYLEIEINENSPNYRLQGFVQMKTEWKLRQLLKERAQIQKQRTEEKQQTQKRKAKKCQN